MPAGLGGFDTQGIWQFGESDTEVLASDLINKGMESVSDQFALDRARLTALEAPAPRRALWGRVTAGLGASGATIATIPIKRQTVKQRVTLSLLGRITTSGTTTAVLNMNAGAGGTVVEGGGETVSSSVNPNSYVAMVVVEIAALPGADVPITLVKGAAAGTVAIQGTWQADILLDGEW